MVMVMEGIEDDSNLGSQSMERKLEDHRTEEVKISEKKI
jgi:hypothetical protein